MQKVNTVGKKKAAPKKMLPGPIAILTAEKNFAHPWIGNPLANRMGLHVGRILLATAFDRFRRLRNIPHRDDRVWIQQLRRDGVVAIPDFLPSDEFARMRDEIVGTIRDSFERFPFQENTETGFGQRKNLGEIGFDRFDGGTLNRFLSLDRNRTPASFALVRSKRFRRLYKTALGFGFNPGALQLYYTRFGSEANHDSQKDFHRDTFHPTLKFWYFVEDVSAEDGPFIYVPGSNRTSSARLSWEHRRSVEVSARTARKGGAFRIDEEELNALGFAEPRTFAVRGNTLVIADTYGFHRRGDGRPGAERFALYGGVRRMPYLF
ncbi:phytanoyl-CoA dioxygenase family protein [Mesorhizobium sp. IMUNJ 23232]|uniref:phytanoyl-CoA dioxygenase family protein n=1 Tax=Mesorhizobium sp. IMUNJ 23232 TaxID=3376064 RepID=UPI00379D82AE